MKRIINIIIIHFKQKFINRYKKNHFHHPNFNLIKIPRSMKFLKFFNYLIKFSLIYYFLIYYYVMR